MAYGTLPEDEFNKVLDQTGKAIAQVLDDLDCSYPMAMHALVEVMSSIIDDVTAGDKDNATAAVGLVMRHLMDNLDLAGDAEPPVLH